MTRTDRPLQTQRILAASFAERPYLCREAANLPITRAQLRAAHRRGLVTRLARGVYIDSAQLKAWSGPRKSLVLRSAVGAMAHGDCAVSHESAAAALGMPCPRGDGRWSECDASITASSSGARRTRSVHIYERCLNRTVTVPGIPVPITPPARTAFDCAIQRNLAEGLVTADSAARMVLERRDREFLLDSGNRNQARQLLVSSGEKLQACPGYLRAATTLALADPAAESPAESYSRGCILGHGLPAPSVGLPVLGSDGRTYYGDLVWPGHRLIGEVDGRDKYTDAAVLRREKSREDALRRAGWTVVRWWGWEMVQTPRSVLIRIEIALAESGT